MVNGALTTGCAEGRGDEAVAERPYYDEIVGYLAPCVRDVLIEDLIEYDRSGVISPLMDDILNRASCLAEADRIVTNLVPSAIAA